jgi:hypothetical protein
VWWKGTSVKKWVQTQVLSLHHQLLTNGATESLGSLELDPCGRYWTPYKNDMWVLESLIEKMEDLLMLIPQVCGA